MAVKAVAMIKGLQQTSAVNTFDAQVEVCPVDGTSAVFGFISYQIPSNVLVANLLAKVTNEVKTEMTNNYGTTWGLLDTVTILNMSVL